MASYHFNVQLTGAPLQKGHKQAQSGWRVAPDHCDHSVQWVTAAYVDFGAFCSLPLLLVQR